jgi:hypothetical protein
LHASPPIFGYRAILPFQHLRAALLLLEAIRKRHQNGLRCSEFDNLPDLPFGGECSHSSRSSIVLWGPMTGSDLSLLGRGWYNAKHEAAILDEIIQAGLVYRPGRVGSGLLALELVKDLAGALCDFS